MKKKKKFYWPIKYRLIDANTNKTIAKKIWLVRPEYNDIIFIKDVMYTVDYPIGKKTFVIHFLTLNELRERIRKKN